MDPEIKAWKHIWGAGQGVGPIKNIQFVREIVEELIVEYNHAKQVVAMSLRQVE